MKFKFYRLILKKLLTKLTYLNKSLRKIILILVDIFIVYFSYWITCFLISLDNNSNYFISLFILSCISLYWLFGKYNALTKYKDRTSFYGIVKINTITTLIVYLLADFIKLELFDWKITIIFCFILNFFIIISNSILSDILLSLLNNDNQNKPKILIYGAGSAGAQVACSLRISNDYKINAFIDDDPSLENRMIYGVNIYPSSKLKELSKNADHILLAIPSLSASSRYLILEKLRKFSLPIFEVPSLPDIISGKGIDNIKPIKLEDILFRPSISDEIELSISKISGSVVCVTGAGGSIGSELCRQILRLKPKILVLIEISEPSLWLIDQYLKDQKSDYTLIKTVMGDASDYNLVSNIFKKYKVKVLFHAAAYKHVPLVESNPLQGISNNVLSTKVLCKASKEYNLHNFILISTDKAVRPTNIMGATKRLAEIIVQVYAEDQNNSIDYSSHNNTIFSSVRFGNVLGSSGSVVPLFEKQISAGGPLTLTHKNINRYFMTIKEASNLVIQSLSLAKGGDVFLLDMGKPVLIKDLATMMINLSGFSVKNKENPDGDIEIIETGLRPAEKLYEETLIDAKALPTKNKLIYRAIEKKPSREFLFKNLKDLESYLSAYNLEKTLQILKLLVPEWKRFNP